MNLRDTEALIRATYRDLLAAPVPGWGRLGSIVSLAELRAALPATLTREYVDEALRNLADHSDVHVIPRSDQRNAHPVDAEAALYLGTHNHALMIDDRMDAVLVVEGLRMRRRERAESMVAALPDSLLFSVGALMGVQDDPDPQVLRRRLVDQSVAAHDAWSAKTTQEADDGTLLFRAVEQPGSLADEELPAALAAAQRHVGNADSWPPLRERAERYLATVA
jgi:hypothetical protein